MKVRNAGLVLVAIALCIFFLVPQRLSGGQIENSLIWLSIVLFLVGLFLSIVDDIKHIGKWR